MRISAKCDYANRALLELSLHWPSTEPMQIHQIAENQNIPMRYLVQILIQLKQLGFVMSIRGKQGGYRLSKPPFRISLGDVIREVGGPLLPVAIDISEGEGENVFRAIWRDAEQAVSEIVDRITFENICEKVKGASKTPNYQI